MTKNSYTTLAWAGVGAGLILFVFNVAAMQHPNVILTWVAVALVVLGIWAASRAKRFERDD
ncbi:MULTISPECIES: hypothetical protein [unclassified Microbacterium]|uniref:hypothetical protein n=1 Tax=unclassified Microbacterium TaxID=2609290 RepID=UPI000EAAC19D|nr:MULTISPECIES: hypothetical protein [unclassified Microbacterium]MBT2485830.1 hypothetical protein [Microbacterium sp. ISL-108]RKN68591.1 hypothetical protein D7252_14025 [Microbacterium sp. CGR2]